MPELGPPEVEESSVAAIGISDQKAIATTPTFGDQEIRISSTGRLQAYVAYGRAVLVEQNKDDVILKGTGNAIPTTIAVAERLKRELGLCQITTVSVLALQRSLDKPKEGDDKKEEDKKEPEEKEEEEAPAKDADEDHTATTPTKDKDVTTGPTARRVPYIEIVLKKTATEAERQMLGFQFSIAGEDPLPPITQSRRGGRGRGGRGGDGATRELREPREGVRTREPREGGRTREPREGREGGEPRRGGQGGQDAQNRRRARRRPNPAGAGGDGTYYPRSVDAQAS